MLFTAILGAFNYKLFTNLGLPYSLPAEASDNRTTQCEALGREKRDSLYRVTRLNIKDQVSTHLFNGCPFCSYFSARSADCIYSFRTVVIKNVL